MSKFSQGCCSLAATAVAAILLAPQARATTIIDWADPSVSIVAINGRTVRVTGFTTGDYSLPFTVMISTVNANLQVTRNPTGGVAVPLNMNMPTPRNSLTLLTLNASLDNGVEMESVSYILLDVDGSPSSTNFRDWRDRVTVTNIGSTLTAVNPNYVRINGRVATATGFNGNVAVTSPNGNVRVSNPGTISSIGFLYGPGPSDQFAANQLIGLSNITFFPVFPVAVPEPGTFALMGAGLGLLLLRRSRRRTGGGGMTRPGR